MRVFILSLVLLVPAVNFAQSHTQSAEPTPSPASPTHSITVYDLGNGMKSYQSQGGRVETFNTGIPGWQHYTARDRDGNVVGQDSIYEPFRRAPLRDPGDNDGALDIYNQMEGRR